MAFGRIMNAFKPDRKRNPNHINTNHRLALQTVHDRSHVALLYTLTGRAGSCNIVCSIFNLLCEAVITGGGRDFSDVAAMVT